MARRIDKEKLAATIRELQGVDNELKSQLLQLLNEKKYGLVWENHIENAEEELRTKVPVLTEVKERFVDSKDPDAPNHILIEGDNLHALNALTYTHEGKVDVIYIDPPYNTGNKDFVYNDSFVDAEDGYRHSKWLSFMEKRLRIAKRLLSDRGVIFISIDDNEQANLKLLCDSVFGVENFRNTILVRRRIKALNLQFASEGLKTLNVGAEYILVYANDNFAFREMRVKKEESSEEGKWNTFWSTADRPTMRYEVLGFAPLSGQWRWSKESADEAVANYIEYETNYKHIPLKEYWEQTGRNKKFIKRDYQSKSKGGGVSYWVPPTDSTLRTSIWTDIEVSQIHKEFDLEFSNPKNKLLIKEIISSPNYHPNIILDFFAGSGTTLHATMQLNSEDGGNRTCIMVTNNENHICENVTYERNKKVIKGFFTPRGSFVEGLRSNKLRYFKTELKERELTHQSKRELFMAMTDLLCIKEDCYTEQPSFGSLPLNGKQKMLRYFAEKDAKMLMIYDTRVIPFIINEIKKMEDVNIKVYVFADGAYPYTEDFADVLGKVTLIPMPHAMVQALKNTLPVAAEDFLAPTDLTAEEQDELMKEAIEAENNEQ